MNTALRKVTIPASVRAIENAAFEYCTQLREIAFAPGSTLKYVGACAFGDTGLVPDKVAFPSGAFVSEDAFEALQLLHVRQPSGFAAGAR